jgi:hypothetical protein
LREEVSEMEEQARTLDLRPLLVVAAIAAGVLTLWASGAFAAGSSSEGGSTGGTPSQFVQDDGQSPSREDCPKDRGGGAPQGDSEGSGDPSL